MGSSAARRRWSGAAAVVAGLVLALALAGCGGSGGGGSAQPAPSPSTPGADLPCGPPAEDMQRPEYAGLAVAEASKLAKRDGLTTRVVGRDGECFAVTQDYRQDRVNFYVEDDVVVWAAIF